MNDQSAALDRLADRYLEESGGDLALAFRFLSADYLFACSHISNGLARIGPVARSGLPPKARVEAIDIPAAASPEASSANS